MWILWVMCSTRIIQLFKYKRRFLMFFATMSDRCQPHYHVISSCLIVKAPFWVGDFLYFLPQRTLKSEHVLSGFHVWWHYPPVIKRAWEIPELNEIGNCPERHFSLMTPVANYSQDHHHSFHLLTNQLSEISGIEAFYTHHSTRVFYVFHLLNHSTYKPSYPLVI